jgi:hypothetical protein
LIRRSVREHPNPQFEKPDPLARDPEVWRAVFPRDSGRRCCAEITLEQGEDHDPVSPNRIMSSGERRANAAFRRS